MKTLVLLLSLSLVGCSTLLKVPTSEKRLSAKEATDKYASVLKKFVNKKGQVDFEGLLKDRSELDQYISYVSETGLDTFTSTQDRLAHMINAYNALSMFVVLERGIPETNSGLKKVGFFVFTKVTVGGVPMSLKTFEDDYIRSLGEDRIHWALNCMAVSCPRLPQVPFTGSKLEQELQAGAVEFFNTSANVRVDEEKKTLWVTEIFDFFPGDFKKYPSIAEYVNRFAKTAVPKDYSIKFIPYDWTINNSNKLSL
jgi:hypothetical protein